MTNQGLPCSSELESLDEESDDVLSDDSSDSLDDFLCCIGWKGWSYQKNCRQCRTYHHLRKKIYV